MTSLQIQIATCWTRTIWLSSVQRHTESLMFSAEQLTQQSKEGMYKTRAPVRPDDKILYGGV